MSGSLPGMDFGVGGKAGFDFSISADVGGGTATSTVGEWRVAIGTDKS